MRTIVIRYIGVINIDPIVFKSVETIYTVLKQLVVYLLDASGLTVT